MLRHHHLAVAALIASGACSLDPSTKPVCVEDSDCNWPVKGHCVEQVCVANVTPTAAQDVIYVTSSASGVRRLSANLLQNDVDPEGDPLKIYDTRVRTPVSFSSTRIYRVSDETVEVEFEDEDLPEIFEYRVSDNFGLTDEWLPITLMFLDTQLTVPVEANEPMSLATVFDELVDPHPGSVELVVAPTKGTLSGAVPNVTYTPAADYCGGDTLTYRVHAANGPIDVVVTLAVGLVLTGEQQTIPFGAPVTIDVLANDRDGLELVATDRVFASIPSSKDALVVNPPVNVATRYTVGYTARDSRGCEGTTTLTLDVEFPTSVVVGEGLAGDAFDAVLSGDGRYLAFTSADATLVANDTNNAADVFVKDLATGAIERVSLATNGTQANDVSGSPTLSADGRYVAFVSRATNLAAADTTAVEDIYLHDRQADTTTLVSITIDGTGSDQPSLTPHISAAGTRIVFASSSTRLVNADTNDAMDVFVRDTGTSTTTRVSVTGSGAQVPYASYPRPRISGNGRYVALSSSSALDGSNQGGAFVVDTQGIVISRIDGSAGEVDIDDVGRFIVHADYQATLVDRVVENVTVLGAGTYPALSADGRYAVYVAAKKVLARSTGMPVEVIVDVAGKALEATPLRRPEISGDGRWIVFSTSEWPGYAGRFVIVRVWNRSHPG